MALCPNCHSEATSGALTPERQRYYKAHPFNFERGFARGLLTINESKLHVALGGNEFTGGGHLIVVDEQPLITLEMNEFGGLDLSLKLYDVSNNLLLQISQNEWLSGDPLPWDILASYQVLTVRQKKGKVALDLDCRKCPIELKGSLWWGGRLIRIGPSSLSVDQTELNTVFAGCTFERTCLSLQTSPQPKVKIKPNSDQS